MTDTIYVGTGGLGEALANCRRLLESDPNAAGAQAHEILRINPGNVEALRLMATALRRLGRPGDAARAEQRALAAERRDRLLKEAADGVAANRLNAAEHILRSHLRDAPYDAEALTLLAEIGYRAGADAGTEELLANALRLAPRSIEAHGLLARLRLRQNRLADSVAALDELLAIDPANVAGRHLKANVLARLGDYDEAVGLHEALVAEEDGNPRIWVSFGDVLKTVGRTDDSIAAYRRVLALDPNYGEAWWSLANLKTAALGDADIEAMRGALNGEPSDEARLHLHFALGKALEDAGSFAESFNHYAEGNRIRIALVPYNAAEVRQIVGDSKALFTPAFFAAHAGSGDPTPDPILIIGMPRAGSTLIEQILASHSMIEGTSELPYIPALARRLGEDKSYPGSVASLDAAELRRLGADYLAEARRHRKLARPYFIDKMPNNWLHLGLIRLILPNAKIIDARRHPLDCCFSNFKQHFSQGQAFAYSLDDLGSHYRQYVELLAHFDTVLPGRIHRVVHERLIDQPEVEIRRLLDYLGLPFEQACLRFHENDRAVRTPSAEQVRRPINRAGMDQWKPFETWLDPLKDALGPMLDSYPDAPAA